MAARMPQPGVLRGERQRGVERGQCRLHLAGVKQRGGVQAMQRGIAGMARDQRRDQGQRLRPALLPFVQHGKVERSIERGRAVECGLPQRFGGVEVALGKVGLAQQVQPARIGTVDAGQRRCLRQNLRTGLGQGGRQWLSQQRLLRAEGVGRHGRLRVEAVGQVQRRQRRARLSQHGVGGAAFIGDAPGARRGQACQQAQRPGRIAAATRGRRRHEACLCPRTRSQRQVARGRRVLAQQRLGPVYAHGMGARWRRIRPF
jgi:hypothetical protein